jgi:hypothetical protein
MIQYSKSNHPDCDAIAEARNLAENMLKIAENGFFTCNEDSCIQLYGLIRDCGYKIRKTVEQEQLGIQYNGRCHNELN